MKDNIILTNEKLFLYKMDVDIYSTSLEYYRRYREDSHSLVPQCCSGAGIAVTLPAVQVT